MSNRNVLLLGVATANLVWSQWGPLEVGPSDVAVRPHLEEGYVEVEYPSPDRDGTKVTAKIPLANQARPVLEVAITPENSHFRYEYRLSNAVDAAASIAHWKIAIPRDHLVSEVREPDGWHHGLSKSRIPSIREALDAEGGVFLNWYPLSKPAGPIAPGKAVDGFYCRSMLKPGLATAFVLSPWPDYSILDTLPLSADRAVYPYLEYRYSSRMVLTAAPIHSPEANISEIVSSFRRRLAELARRPDDPAADFSATALRLLGEYLSSPEAGQPTAENNSELCRFVRQPTSSPPEHAIALALHFNFCLSE